MEAIEAQDEMHNSVIDWQLVNPNPGWDNVSVTAKCGELVESLAEVVAYTDRLMVGVLSNCLGRGSFFISNGSLVTNYHCTKGNDVYLTRGGRTHKFSKPIFMSEKQDLVIYGRKFEFTKATPGEIVTAFNPKNRFGVHYVVQSTGEVLQGRGQSTFMKMIPVKLGMENGPEVMHMPVAHGMSGSPIVNFKGDVVGIFGLGISNAITNALGDVVYTTANLSATGEIKIENEAFFKMCASNLVNKPLEVDKKIYYCNAPTGTGKTTLLPPAIVEVLQSGRDPRGARILILQPNVTSVVNCAKRIYSGIEIKDIRNCKVTYEVGLRNETSTESFGPQETEYEIMICKTFGITPYI